MRSTSRAPIQVKRSNHVPGFHSCLAPTPATHFFSASKCRPQLVITLGRTTPALQTAPRSPQWNQRNSICIDSAHKHAAKRLT